jgi:ATP-binding cassette subfamily G (WHITE) protein 2 (SNQ2)
MAADPRLGTPSPSREPHHENPSPHDSTPSDNASSADGFSPIRSAPSKQLELTHSRSSQLDRSISRFLSRRTTTHSGHGETDEDWAEIQRLMSRMFGRERQENSEEEKTRHVGVVWRHLTVKGVGLGAALQPTNGDIFLGLPRMIKGLLTHGRKGTGAGKPPVKTILRDFTVSIQS